MNVLDAFPYPWADPVAQQLHETLARVHSTSQAAMLVAAKIECIDTSMIFADQAPAFL